MAMLVSYDWTLPPHSEKYYCVRTTADHDFLITRMEPVAPLGTHHTVLTRGDNSTPDGVTECSSVVFLSQMIFGGGVGTQAMDMPPGVIMKVAKGQQVLLNLHLFNAADEPLSGRSGVRVKTAEPAGQVEGEALLVGTLSVSVPPGTSTTYGSCTVRADATLFAIAPHMHRLGIHQKVTLDPAGTTLMDRDYTFDQQTFETVSVPLHTGDEVRIACGYANDGMSTIGWGESTTTEMCFSFLLVYPAGRNPFLCLN